MNTHDLIVGQFEKLTNEARSIISDARMKSGGYVSSSDYLRFRTAALNLIRRSCGEDSDHYRELRRLAEDNMSANNSDFTSHCLGVLEAAKADYEAGLLFDIRSLLEAELLGDFLEQAETLLSAGYYVPAASLAGAVLEDTLRKLCERKKIPYPSPSKIDHLNSELARAGLYNKLIQKRITAIADIRNNADHGHFDKFKKEDVEDMVKWIRSFSADNLR